MKPFIIMLLIAAVVAFSDLVGRGEASRRAARRLPFVPLPGLRRRRLGDLELEVGTSLIGDTQAQVEQFVALSDGDAQSAVDTVNVAHD